MKRWYRATGIDQAPEDFGIELDGKPLRTPSKRPLRVPTETLARAIAGEWDGQDGVVAPATMPLTRLAATAIDRIAPDSTLVLANLAAYARSDLVCFRADHPSGLVERQTACWQPLVTWAALKHDAALAVTTGVMPREQPQPAILALEKVLDPLDSFRLVALHTVATQTGSLVIALALLDGHLTGEEAFSAGVLDELWSLEIWGHDTEAALALEIRKADILTVERFLQLLRCGEASLAGRHGTG